MGGLPAIPPYGCCPAAAAAAAATADAAATTTADRATAAIDSSRCNARGRLGFCTAAGAAVTAAPVGGGRVVRVVTWVAAPRPAAPDCVVHPRFTPAATTGTTASASAASPTTGATTRSATRQGRRRWIRPRRRVLKEVVQQCVCRRNALGRLKRQQAVKEIPKRCVRIRRRAAVTATAATATAAAATGPTATVPRWPNHDWQRAHSNNRPLAG